MLKIGFFLDNTHCPSADFSRPWEGNPGTGAAEYLHVAIPHFISTYSQDNIDCIIFAPHIDQLPKSVSAQQSATIIEAAHMAKSAGVDYFVFRPRMSEEKGILDVLEKLRLPSIGRAALTPHPQHLRRMAACHAFKALVCVGKEQYDFLVDTPMRDKRVYIDNGIHVKSCEDAEEVQKDLNLVTYMGALVQQKGFHLLAQAWPKVIARHPTAQLSVIGSVKMYNENAILGPLGVAEDAYERQYLLPHLTDKQGKLLPSVTFHGKLGKEKYSILRRSLIGVANPSGQTETCCVSAVEMSACRTAVVSGAFYALLDTVVDGSTGLLGRTTDDLADNICKLLENPDLAIEMGQRGYERSLKKYDFSIVSQRWVELFQHLNQGEIPKPSERLKNLASNFKFLRFGNSIFQKTVGTLLFWPSVYEFEVLLRKLIKR